jgi:tetratricopeptide (TPR) repeat protein
MARPFMKDFRPMTRQTFRLSAAALALALASLSAYAQSGATRPRRVTPVQPTTTTDAAGSTASTGRAATTPAAAGPAQTTTAHAFTLLQQKQYDAALKEAKQIASADEKNAEAWKIAGFAEFYLKQYAQAAEDLGHALDLRKASGGPDAETERALAQAYFFAEDYERALPMLTAATKPGAKPDADMLYYRGIAEMNLTKSADAERSFGEVLKVDPKNKFALLYLGQLAYARGDYTASINSLNRATLADPSLVQGWEFLVSAYLSRAKAATGAAADADYLSAVRAADSLARLRNDEQTAALQGQALFFAKQYVRAAAALERAAASPKAPAGTHFLLGYSYFQAKNYPKAITALEQAAARTPDNADIYRLLGFSYETTKQYAKALEAYEKGLQLAPTDAYFKEGADRVRPVAKP